AVDARSDIFSVGTVLYEMLAGRPPFAGDTAADTMAAILKEEPPRPPSSNVPAALLRIVARCLEKTREMRFQSARDLAFGLEVLSESTATAAPSTDRPRWLRRRALPWIVAGALALGLAGVIAWTLRRPLPPLAVTR